MSLNNEVYSMHNRNFLIIKFPNTMKMEICCLSNFVITYKFYTPDFFSSGGGGVAGGCYCEKIHNVPLGISFLFSKMNIKSFIKNYTILTIFK